MSARTGPNGDPLVKPSENEQIVTDSYHFAEESCKQDTNLCMARLDADFLFTNIPLEETIDIFIHSLYNNN